MMNVMVFIPVGLLLGIAFKQVTWWKALLIGSSISISIESLQFWFMKGFSEVDDVMHNTVGCIMGYIIYSILVRIFTNTKLKLDYA
jgi:glycopeptide antibiotics resistance protein